MVSIAKLNEIFVRYWQLLAAALLSFSLQFSLISVASVWHDEGYTALLIKSGWSELIARTARDVHPPLYYLLLKLWSLIFGSSEAALRSLSLVAIIGVIGISFLLIRRLFNAKIANFAAWMLALAPFLIRYGIEARMYALAALLVVVTTYLLVAALDSNNRKLYLAYAVILTLAFYTHYYTVLIVPVHWIYVFWRQQDNKKWLAKWLGVNLVIASLFTPWLAVLYRQFTRVQGGFWIPPVSWQTLPDTLQQFWLLSTPLSAILALGILIGLIILVAYVIKLNPKYKSQLVLLSLYASLPPMIILLVSLISRPAYVDRYFAFSAVGFYLLVAVIICLKPLNTLRFRQSVFLVLLGISMIYAINSFASNHHLMRPIGDIVSKNYQSGDSIIAGELYVYFDFSYYNQTNTTTKLYAPDGVSGYGETSLLYDKPSLLIENYSQLTASERVWIIGKPGKQAYFDKVPKNWQLKRIYTTKTSVARLYIPQTLLQ